MSRLNISYTVLSKRKLLKLVINNYMRGWDDPRMPTIKGNELFFYFWLFPRWIGREIIYIFGIFLNFGLAKMSKRNYNNLIFLES